MIHEIMWISGFIIITWAVIRWAFVVADKLPIWLDADWRQQAEEFLNFTDPVSAPSYKWWTPTLLTTLGYHRFYWIPVIGPWLDNRKAQSIFEAFSILIALFLMSLPQREAFFGIGFCGMLLCLALIDKRTMLLPDVIVYPFLWLGIIKALQSPEQLMNSVTGLLLGFLILFLLQKSFKLLRGKEGMGGGDVKLLAALGAWLGSSYIIIALLVACVISIIIYLIIKIFIRTASTKFPFGPSLAISGFVFYLLIPYMEMA